MTLGRTFHVSDWAGAGENDRTTSAFTPPASAKTYVMGWGESSATFTQSVADSLGNGIGTGSNPFTQVADSGVLVAGSGNRGRLYLWEQDSGASPASRTVTITSSGDGSTAYTVWSVTGNGPRIKAGQLAVDGLAGGGAGTTTLGDLGVAATNGALVMCVVGANIDTANAFPTPSGFSVVDAPARPGSEYEAPALFDRTNFTGVNTTIANTGNSGNNFAGVLLEFEEAPPPLVASVSSNVWDGTSSGDVAKPSDTVDDDLLIAVITSDGSSAAIPAGFTSLPTSGFSGTVDLVWGYKVASSEGSTYTFTGNGDNVAFILRVTGHDPTVTITQVAGVSVASGNTNAVAPGLTPAGTNDLLISVASHDGDAATAPIDDLNWTPPGSMTEHADRHSGGWVCSSIASEQLTSGAATGTRTFDPISTNHREGAAGTISIKASGGGAPTYVTKYLSAFDTNTSPKSAPSSGSFNGAIGDVLVSMLAIEIDSNSGENFAWSNTGGSAGTWAEDTESSGSGGNDCFVQSAHLELTSAITAGTVVATRSAGDTSKVFGHAVGHFTDTDGIGASSQKAGAGSATGSFTIDTTQANSAVMVMFADFAAADGDSLRTYPAINGHTPVAGGATELHYYRNSSQYTVYCVYYPDVGAAGTKTLSVTPGGAGSPDILGVAVEILGSGGGGEPPPDIPVEFVSQGTPVAGTTSITTAAIGAGAAETDLIVGVVASNHATVDATEPTIANFALSGTLVGGGGTQGVGTGNRRLSFFTREMVAGDDTTPTVSLSGGNVMIAAFSVFRKPAGYTWETAVAALIAEATAGTGWTQALGSDPGFNAEDMIVAACAVRDTSNSSAEGFSATGATFSALTEQADLSSETGNDIALHVATADVLTGPSSANGTRTATHSTSETGVMGVLRIRSTAPAPPSGAFEGWGVPV